MTPAQQTIKQAMLDYAATHDGWFAAGDVFSGNGHTNEQTFRTVLEMVAMGMLQEVLDVKATVRGYRYRRKA